MLCNNSAPQLTATQMLLDMQWSMQGGAAPHTANALQLKCC
jgi:hypothetical protein